MSTGRITTVPYPTPQDSEHDYYYWTGEWGTLDGDVVAPWSTPFKKNPDVFYAGRIVEDKTLLGRDRWVVEIVQIFHASPVIHKDVCVLNEQTGTSEFDANLFEHWILKSKVSREEAWGKALKVVRERNAVAIRWAEKYPENKRPRGGK